MKYKLKQILLFLLMLHLSLGLSAATTDETSKSIHRIIEKNKIDRNHLGLDIANLNSPIFSLNEKKQFIPASVTKIVTAYAVLKNIPQNFKFKTELYYDGTHLYLKGGGDPSFVSENMWFLVNEFKRHHIGEIAGDIVVDDSLFDQVRYDETRESTRVDRSYDAPVGAMSFNWNSINIFVKPGKIGEAAIVQLDPESQYFKLVNKTTTRQQIKKELVISVNQEAHQITVSGDVDAQALEKAYYKNVADPVMWSGENLKSFLGQRGISIKGRVRAGQVKISARLVARAESKSLDFILADMNKFSNNYIAEMLVKNLVIVADLEQNKSFRQATLKSGMTILQEELDQIKIKSTDMIIKNPSGFSRDNKMSARSLNVILEKIEKDFASFPSFLTSLPIAGLDGTLKKRLKGTAAQGFVRAKTGYLDGVVTLSGYLGKPDGDIIRFTFLYNGPQDEAKVRETFDQILLSILN